MRNSSPNHPSKPVRTENWIYGKNPVFEALKAKRREVFNIEVTDDFLNQPKNKDLLDLAQKAKVKVLNVSVKVIDKKVGDVAHQNIMARVGAYPYQHLTDVLSGVHEHSLILALDEITDPQNFATLCRSALAFGVTAIVIPQDRSVAVTAAVCKASAGGIEHAKVVKVVNLSYALEELKKRNFWIYGTTLKPGSQALGSFSPAPSSVLVMGSEGKGLRPLVEKNCDMLVHIPMHSDFDSLNVAQAGSIALYEFAKVCVK